VESAGSSSLRRGRELELSRIIAAPRARVFEVWTTRLRDWWGPHGFTAPVSEIDLRAGGVFRTVLRAPDGTDYPTRGIFLEVIPPERIVFTDAFDPGWVPHPDIFFTGLVIFDARGMDQTSVTIRALHWSAASCERHEQMGFHHGWGESLDRLAAIVMNVQGPLD
jgi:uncharacterized protein YndB with AHSA1/START domain